MGYSLLQSLVDQKLQSAPAGPLGLHLSPTLVLAVLAFAVAMAAYLLSTSTLVARPRRNGSYRPSNRFLVLMYLSVGVVNLAFLFRSF